MSPFTCNMWNAYVDPWDMLNNFCFQVGAQKCQVVRLSRLIIGTCWTTFVFMAMLKSHCLLMKMLMSFFGQPPPQHQHYFVFICVSVCHPLYCLSDMSHALYVLLFVITFVGVCNHLCRLFVLICVVCSSLAVSSDRRFIDNCCHSDDSFQAVTVMTELKGFLSFPAQFLIYYSNIYVEN